MVRKKEKPYTIREAFRAMLLEPGACKRSGMAAQTALNKRHQVTRGNYPTEKVMRYWLRRTGWRIGRPERWKLTRTLSLRAAYRTMLAEQFLARHLGVSVGTVTHVRTRVHAEKTYPPVVTMRDWLGKRGWHCVAQEEWLPPA